MSIDTRQKRSSVFELPGLMMNPFPDGSITAPDRHQISDIYSGISASTPGSISETCWNPSLGNTSSWVKAQTKTSSWVSERTGSSIWVPEKEVVPCPD